MAQFLKLMGGSPGQVVVGGDSRSKGRGFESQCRILDGHEIFSHRFVVKNCIACLKRPKVNKIEAGLAHFLKKVLIRLLLDSS